MHIRKTTIFLILFIFLIILFDAFQQQYYLRTYDILENGASISFFELFSSHFIRWCIWGICSVPLALFSWKMFAQSNSEINTSQWLRIIGIGLVAWVLSIMLISTLSIVTSEEPFNRSNFLSFVEFFVAQKGISFLFAYSVLVLAIYNNAKSIVIDAQWMEIKELSTASQLNGKSRLEPQVSIKIGNKMKLLPLTDVTWIESDDYCVKIHTEEKSYSLRKSLKSLEKQLASYQFIRVHRCALLNLEYLDQVDFESSLIKLQDASELPLSKSGAQVLRTALKASSI
ncbi:MAG: LytTR family DNA-binding domain-containing protein [Balneola sp.]